MKSVSPIRKCEFCFLNFCIFVFPPLLCSEPLAEALTFDVFQVQWFSSGMRSCFSLSSQLIKLRSNFVRGPQTNNLLLSVCLRLRFHSRGLKGRVMSLATPCSACSPDPSPEMFPQCCCFLGSHQDALRKIRDN